MLVEKRILLEAIQSFPRFARWRQSYHDAISPGSCVISNQSSNDATSLLSGNA